MRKPLFLRISWWRVARRFARWRVVLGFHWSTWIKDKLVFSALLACPFVVLGSFGYYTYSGQLAIAAERRQLAIAAAAEQRQLAIAAAAEQRRDADLTCLAHNIYYEARGEPMAGQYAVGEVTLNRVSSRHYPNTVCEVVHEKRWDAIRERYVGAFSWTEFESRPKPKGKAWQRAQAVAEAVYDAKQKPQVQGALFFHATKIEPRWANSEKRVAQIGNHIFYE